ncbi:hypothetical protein AB4254_11095 [Vibrio breoganii]
MFNKEMLRTGRVKVFEYNPIELAEARKKGFALGKKWAYFIQRL